MHVLLSSIVLDGLRSLVQNNGLQIYNISNIYYDIYNLNVRGHLHVFSGVFALPFFNVALKVRYISNKLNNDRRL